MNDIAWKLPFSNYTHQCEIGGNNPALHSHPLAWGSMGRTRARYCKGITCIDTIGLQKLQDSSNHGLKKKIFFLNSRKFQKLKSWICCTLATTDVAFHCVCASQVAQVLKNPLVKAGDIRDTGSIPGWGRSPGEGNGNPLQYSCLENPHGQRSPVGYSPWGRRVRNDRSDWARLYAEMIYSIWQNVHRLFANSMPFYQRDSSICRFWHLGDSWNPIPGYPRAAILYLLQVKMWQFPIS